MCLGTMVKAAIPAAVPRNLRRLWSGAIFLPRNKCRQSTPTVLIRFRIPHQGDTHGHGEHPIQSRNPRHTIWQTGSCVKDQPGGTQEQQVCVTIFWCLFETGFAIASMHPNDPLGCLETDWREYLQDRGHHICRTPPRMSVVRSRNGRKARYRWPLLAGQGLKQVLGRWELSGIPRVLLLKAESGLAPTPPRQYYGQSADVPA